MFSLIYFPIGSNHLPASLVTFLIIFGKVPCPCWSKTGPQCDHASIISYCGLLGFFFDNSSPCKTCQLRWVRHPVSSFTCWMKLFILFYNILFQAVHNWVPEWGGRHLSCWGYSSCSRFDFLLGMFNAWLSLLSLALSCQTTNTKGHWCLHSRCKSLRLLKKHWICAVIKLDTNGLSYSGGFCMHNSCTDLEESK